MRVRKALIPAAGLGTRFLPVTKAVPKELLPIIDRPAVEYIVEELAESGIEEVIFVVNRDKKAISEHFRTGGGIERFLKTQSSSDRLKSLNKLIAKIKFKEVHQAEAKGLGHAVGCGKEAIGDEPFVVVLPDDLVRSRTPCTRQLLKAYEAVNCSMVAVEQVAKERTQAYGIVSGATDNETKPFKVTGVVEKPKPEEAPSRWAIIGRYVLDPEVFSILEHTKPGAIGEVQLTDALLELAKTRGLVAFPFEGRRIDTGHPFGWLEANLEYALDRKELVNPVKELMKEIQRR